jgi:hypothetical protein
MLISVDVDEFGYMYKTSVNAFWETSQVQADGLRWVRNYLVSFYKALLTYLLTYSMEQSPS